MRPPKVYGTREEVMENIHEMYRNELAALARVEKRKETSEKRIAWMEDLEKPENYFELVKFREFCNNHPTDKDERFWDKFVEFNHGIEPWNKPVPELGSETKEMNRPSLRRQRTKMYPLERYGSCSTSRSYSRSRSRSRS